MNNILKFKKIIITILAIIMLIVFVGNTAKAVIDETKKVSLTIKKYEHVNGKNENLELKGVEFTISLIPNDISNVDEAIDYIRNNQVSSYKKITPDNGTVKFENLEQGRYLVQETDAPKNVVSKVESFLVDLPRTNDKGNGWDYDVTIYPKNITIYGTVTLNQLTKNGKNMQGARWELQKLNSTQEWKKYDYEGDLLTDIEGKIKIQNLEVGKYRLIEKETTEGYILDQTNPIEFEIDLKNINYEFTATNETLHIEKAILQDDGSYGTGQGAFKTDTNSWKITADVAGIIAKMSVYKITDKLPEGLLFKSDSIKVKGMNKNDEEVIIPEEYYTKKIQTNILEINFETKQLNKYKNIIVQYDTNFKDEVSFGSFINKASLIYTDYINSDGISQSEHTTSSEAEVHTGAVLIYKTDEYDNPLEGASFKIATTKENAKKEKFITDKNGDEIIATSDENGYVVFEGLKYNDSTSYWIVEIEAPSYEEDGKIKHYNLLQKPVEVKVDSTSQNYSEENTTIVINKKPFELPLAGGTLSIISSVLGLCIISSYILIKKRKSKCEE